MFKKKCDFCHEKEVFVYAVDRQGNLPVAYCSKECKVNSQYNKRFDKRFE